MTSTTARIAARKNLAARLHKSVRNAEAHESHAGNVHTAESFILERA
jgi:hypothetical protein